MKTRSATALLAGLLILAAGPLLASDAVTMLNSRDMMIQPASDTATVQLHFAGADRIDFGVAGELYVIRTNGARVRYRPDVYQMVHGKMRMVAVNYTLVGHDRVTMNFGKFDRSLPVILRRGASTL